ncbi:aminopeptidase P family protein [Candidatus Microgenomates bacterium]|nr:MAG: aminopeptidase P family protein [Candidatus Microgenomates bacterium]
MQILRKDLDALLISNPTNIRYLTGFVSAAPQEREAYVLVATNAMYLFTNSLYLEQAKEIIPASLAGRQLSPAEQDLALPDNNQINTNYPIKLLEISRIKPLTNRLSEIFESEFSQKQVKLGFESNDLTVAEYTQIKRKLADVQLVATQNLIEQQRILKTGQEITSIKKACAITDACFDAILKKIKPGISETELTWEIETFFRKNGAESSFSPIVAFNENSSQPHYTPSSRFTLNASPSLILLDFGARFNGYCADMTRMVHFGNPPEKIRNTYQALRSAQEKAVTLLASGERSGAKLDAAARKILTQHNLPEYPHSLGHGIGLDIHEAPRLTIRQNEELKPGMVFSIEPGIYFEGKFGMRLEDLVLINEKNEIEVLTKSAKMFTLIT